MIHARPALERIAWMSAELRAGRDLNCFTAARHFDCAEKTIHRDLEFMRDRLGFDLEYDRSTHFWKLLNTPNPLL